MLRRQLGNSGIDASVVAFGAWAIGGWKWGGSDDDEAVRAIHASIDQGIDFIDTAPVYGFGHSEEVVGRAIHDRRGKVVLATKCGLRWDKEVGHFFFSHERDTPTGKQPVDIYIYDGPESIRNEVEESLRRLKTDYIDLYQTHWQDPTTPIEDTMEVLVKLKEQGKIRAIGVCNATPSQMKAYQSIGPLASDQEKFSMLDQKHSADQRQFAAEEGLAYLAYSPLGQGLLTGKITPDRVFSADDQRSSAPRYSIENRRKVLALLDEFTPVLESHKITPAQLAIAWTFHQHGCSHILAGARNEAQVSENARAGDVKLSEEELTRIQGALEKHLPGIE
jgi:methylglyoxal reductase